MTELQGSIVVMLLAYIALRLTPDPNPARRGLGVMVLAFGAVAALEAVAALAAIIVRQFAP